MPDLHPLAGVYAAALTPLREGGPAAGEPGSALDLDAVPGLLHFLHSRGCHGALILGTTGEGPSFSPTEREILMRAAVAFREQEPDFRLLAGTGTPSLDETIGLTRLAFRLGYEGVVVLPPYYYRKASEDGLFRWFSELIGAAVPEQGYLLGYHIPGITGVGFSIDLLSRLKEAFPRQFAGIKDSSHDPDFACALGDRFGRDLLVLSGTDSYLELAMQHGAQGCITAPANLISPDLRALWEGLIAGEDVGDLQRRVTEQRHVLESQPPFPPLLKALIHRMYEFPRWPVRAPLEPVAREVEERLLEELSLAA
ncbi:MAG: dihydrodipicolinate synthase family protein [Bacteroidota bacterium]